MSLWLGTVASSRKSGIVTSGLVLNLDAGNTASYPGSGTTWTDLSGNSRNGTLINSPTYISTYGGGLVFNGTSQQVNISQSGTNFNNNFTVEIWYKATSNAWDWLLNINGYNQGMSLTANGNKARWSYGDWFTEGVTGSIPTQTAANIYQLVFQRNGSALNTWQNGNIIGTPATTSYSSISTTAQINLAKGPSSDYFGGTLYIIRIYSSALTSQEVNQNFLSNRSRFGI